MRRHLGIPLLAVLPLITLAACGGSSTPESGTTTSVSEIAATAPRAGSSHRSSTALTDWPTYHRTNYRNGRATQAAPKGPLRQVWKRSLPGAVYGEPLVVGTTMIVATERNYVYGLNARTGATRWRARLGTPQPLSGLPCGNIDPLGVTSTPAYDGPTGSVFVVAETTGGAHTLWALDPRTGAGRWHRNLDTQTNRNKLAEQQRSALLVQGGRVITTFGGLAGDCSNYVGYVTSVPTSGTGATTSYAVPTAREAGMWSTPGAVRGPVGDKIYVASGNGAELNGTWDKSDSVTELDTATLTPSSVFAPSTWRDDNVRDLDLGSSSPVSVNAVQRLLIAGKRGVVYLLPAGGFGGVGSEIAQVRGCTAFGGAAVYDRIAVMPCKGENAIRALRVTRTGLSWAWTRSGVYSSPTIAGQRVYAADQRTGDLVILNLGNGAVVGRRPAGSLPHFPSQIISGNYVFVPTLTGVTAFQGH